MKKKYLCLDRGEDKIEWSRNAKGIWTPSFTISCDDPFDGMQISDALMTVAEEMIKEHNAKGVEVYDTEDKSK